MVLLEMLVLSFKGFLSSHSVSVVSDVLIAEEQAELQPPEPLPDVNNQLIKPSEGSLTQTSEKIVIHVTDHSDTSKGIFFLQNSSLSCSFVMVNN